MTVYNWRGPAFLPHPRVDPTKFYNEFRFEAASDEDAVRQAAEAYNASSLGELGITVQIGRDEADMRQSMRDVHEGRSKVIKIYREAAAASTQRADVMAQKPLEMNPSSA